MNLELNLHRRLALALAVVALVYAAVAGLRTVNDFDLGWQLATGRYVLQHHSVPATDVFSYTARGNPWIYPPFSGFLFYLLWRAGGFAALSWLGAAASVATVALLLWAARGNRGASFSSLLALIAVPLIAFRTAPRADLFTTLLFAAFLAVVSKAGGWRPQTGESRGTPASRLLPPASIFRLLPLLMVAWVNLHLGFIAGLALLAGWVASELSNALFAARRAGARLRLRRAAPWLAAAGAATLLNPWGPWIYAAIVRQSRILKIHSAFVGEWGGAPVSLPALRQALDWRSPDSAYWWLLAAAVAAFVAALWRRQPGPALLLAAAVVVSLHYVRFQALFAMVAIVTSGELLSSPESRVPSPRSQVLSRSRSRLRTWDLGLGTWDLKVAGVALLAAATAFAGVRIADLISNSYYLSAGETSLFGAGQSWWYPERAADFLLRERLPGNIFHDYNLGGYLVWRLGGQYPDYIDGRAVPFGAPLFFHHRGLQQQPPDSEAWQQEADRRGINTLIFSVARYAGLGGIPLAKFCHSRLWQPVYLDDVAVILIRNRAENGPWINRLKIDCDTVPFRPPASMAGHAAELYNYWANAGAVLYMLERDAESSEALERARRIYPGDANLYLTIGQLLQANNRVEDAVHAYQTAVRLKETDAAWYALGRAYAALGNYEEAAGAIRRSAALSFHAYDRYRALGQLYLKAQSPREALEAFDEAERLSPFKGEAAGQGIEFNYQLSVGRAQARQLLEAQSQVQSPKPKVP